MPMNKDYVLSQLNNSKTKKVYQEHTHVEVDTTTGEMVQVISDSSAKVDREPDYIKLYTDCQLAFKNLDLSLSPYIVAFARHMTYANNPDQNKRCIVRTGRLERQDVAAIVGVSVSMVDKTIKKLVQSDIFIPIQQDGKRLRGYYFVNPWVIAKGDWKDIKQLRAQFEFISGASSSMIVDSTGSARVLIADNVDPDGQYRLELQ